jgi:hypothetical protein
VTARTGLNPLAGALRENGGERMKKYANISYVRMIQIICSGLLFIGFFAPVQAWARSLEEIRKTNELRICVAGSSYELYTAMALAFAEHLGVSPRVTSTPTTWSRTSGA